MKNLLALFLIFCILGFSQFFLQLDDFKSYQGNVTFVADIQNKYPVCAKVIESGGKSYVSADLKYLKNLQNNLNNIHSFSFEFDNLNSDQFMKEYNVKILKTETVDDKTVIYGYSTRFTNHIFIDNKMVNVQIVQGEKLKVGVPLILDCF